MLEFAQVKPTLEYARWHLSRYDPKPNAHIDEGALLAAAVLGQRHARLTDVFEGACAFASDSHASNRLRRTSELQVAADLLGRTLDRRLSTADFKEAYDEVRGWTQLSTTVLDQGVALAMRYQEGALASDGMRERTQLPVTLDVVTLVHLLSAQVLTAQDVQSLPELGLLSLRGIKGSNINNTATLLALSAVHGAEGLPERIHRASTEVAEAIGPLSRSEPRWEIEKRQPARLVVEVSGAGALCAGLPWVLEDLVYCLPEHVHHLMRRRAPITPLEMLHGAASRGEARSAARKRGIETVIKLRGLTVREEDRLAMEARQAAGWQWVALHHPELAEMRRPMRFKELRLKGKAIAPV